MRTLLGAIATYFIQRSTIGQQQALARAENLRQERVAGITALGGAIADYRRQRMDVRYAQRRDTTLDLEEMRINVFRARAKVLECSFRVELLVDDPRVTESVRAAIDTIGDLDPDADLESYKAARARSRAAMLNMISIARAHLNALRM